MDGLSDACEDPWLFEVGSHIEAVLEISGERGLSPGLR
jgi:hypothetical protein